MNKRRALCLALFLAFIVSVSFWGARNHPFSSYDDVLHVTRNNYIRPPSLEKFWFFWRVPFNATPVKGVPPEAGGVSSPYLAIYAPLAFTTWGLLTYVAGENVDQSELIGPHKLQPLDPSIYHSFNLLLHLANVLLVFLLIRMLVKSDWGAVIGALIFGVHPVQTEAVAWVTGMNNLLSTFFALLAILAHLSFVQREKKNWWLYSVGILAFLAAVLAKPSSTPLPVMVLFLLWAQGKLNWRRAIELVPWFVVAVVCVLVARRMIGDSAVGASVAWYYRPLLVGDALAFYLAKVVWPFNLTPDYGRKPAWILANWWGYVTPLVPVVILLLLGGLWKGDKDRRPLYRFIAAGLAIFSITLIPTSGIITYYFHLISTVADRYLYFALIGVGLAVAAMVAWWLEHAKDSSVLKTRSYGIALGLVFLAAFLSWRTVIQVDLWRTDDVLWRHALELNPRSATATMIVSTDTDRDGQTEKALELLRHGLLYEPGNWKLLNGAGTMCRRLGRREEALQYFRRTLKVYPSNVDAHYKMGMTLEEEGKIKEAVYEYGEGLKVQPDHADLLAHFGIAAEKLGNPQLGELYLRRAIKAGFDAGAGRFFLGVTLAQQGKMQDAMEQWSLSLNDNPNFYETHFNVGLAYLKMGQLDEAISSFQETIRLKPDYALAYLNLGITLERRRQYDDAAKNIEIAIGLEPDKPAYKTVLARVLKLKAARKPAAP